MLKNQKQNQKNSVDSSWKAISIVPRENALGLRGGFAIASWSPGQIDRACSRAMFIWRSRGDSWYELSRACRGLVRHVHTSGSWGWEQLGTQAQALWRQGMWPHCVITEQGHHVLEKPPNLHNNGVIHVRTRPLSLESPVGLVR